jgi:hypothetical protein
MIPAAPQENVGEAGIEPGAIDVSWVDWAYKSSICDVMYRRQRRHLYYGGHI